MNKINMGRVLLGGLAAGLIVNIGNYLLNRVWLRDAMNVEFARLHLPEPGSDFIVTAVVLTFILGIAIVYLYAAIRPRCGPGPKTAICAGLMAWFFVVLYAGVIIGTILRFPHSLTLKRVVWGLFEYAVAAIAGAWLYKE